MQRLLTICLVLILAFGVKLLAPQAQEHAPDRLIGQVIHVGDGDSITLLDQQQQRHRIRLGEIDAPEIGQAFGQAAKRALHQLVHQQQVEVALLDTDQYGRIVGTVYLDDLDVNAYMLSQGMAWVYRQHLRRPELIALEQEAQAQKRGLWQQPENQRIAPWIYRQNNRRAE